MLLMSHQQKHTTWSKGNCKIEQHSIGTLSFSTIYGVITFVLICQKFKNFVESAERKISKIFNSQGDLQCTQVPSMETAMPA